MNAKKEREKPRPVEQVRADLAMSRAKLTDSVRGFVEDVQPKNIAKRAATGAKDALGEELKNLKSQVKDDHGWRVDRLLVVGGAILGAVTLLLTVRAVVRPRRRQKDMALSEGLAVS